MKHGRTPLGRTPGQSSSTKIRGVIVQRGPEIFDICSVGWHFHSESFARDNRRVELVLAWRGLTTHVEDSAKRASGRRIRNCDSVDYDFRKTREETSSRSLVLVASRSGRSNEIGAKRARRLAILDPRSDQALV